MLKLRSVRRDRRDAVESNEIWLHRRALDTRAQGASSGPFVSDPGATLR